MKYWLKTKTTLNEMFEIANLIENRNKFVGYLLLRSGTKPFVEIALENKITLFPVQNEL